MSPRRLLILSCLILCLLAACSPLRPSLPPSAAGTGGPVPSGPTSPPLWLAGRSAETPVVSDYSSAINRLSAAGAMVEEGGPTTNSVLKGQGRILRVNGAEVQIFEYPDEASADAEAARISTDGTQVGGAKVDWTAPPHFYLRGRLLAVYTGSDVQVINPLEFVLGRQIAGDSVSGTPAPTATRLATAASVAISTTLPPKTATARANCTSRAVMLADVTVPDNAVLRAGQGFIKTWRLRNTGTCAWGTDYALLFASGDALGAPATVPLTGTVAPGATVDVSVPMTTPLTAGTYRGNWRLSDWRGKAFGIDNSRDGTFWVLLKVPTSATATPAAKIANTVGPVATASPIATATSAAAPSATAEPRPSPMPAPSGGTQRIDFPPDTTSVTLSVEMGSGNGQSYVVNAKSGQNMQIWLGGPGTTLTVTDPKGTVLHPVSATADGLYGEYLLLANGDYTIVLHGQNNTITIEKPPK